MSTTRIVFYLTCWLTGLASCVLVRADDHNGIRVLAWNIESGGSDPDVINSQLKELYSQRSFNVIALSEVPPNAQQLFGGFWSPKAAFKGTTGNGDRLLLAWDPELYETIDRSELREFDSVRFGEGGNRAPMIVLLRRKSDGLQFFLINNHLTRGNDASRNKQASALVEWARRQSLPVLAVGDYNMDYSFVTKTGNEAFSIMLRDRIFEWKQPKEWIDTNWADRNKDGIDDYPDSMLDFVFVANGARQWNIEVEHIVRPGDFPDDEMTSDHRPVLTIVK